MGELQDLVDTILGSHKIHAERAVAQKKMGAVDATTTRVQARLQGLEEALAQVLLKVEQLAPLLENQGSVVKEDTPTPEDH